MIWVHLWLGTCEVCPRWSESIYDTWHGVSSYLNVIILVKNKQQFWHLFYSACWIGCPQVRLPTCTKHRRCSSYMHSSLSIPRLARGTISWHSSQTCCPKSPRFQKKCTMCGENSTTSILSSLCRSNKRMSWSRLWVTVIMSIWKLEGSIPTQKREHWRM